VHRATRFLRVIALAGIAGGGAVSPPALASQCGMASWYAMGVKTASGERMDADGLAAAHRSLPFGTRVKVENLSNGRSVEVRINDRGPFAAGRVIDVTRGAARQLDMIRAGVAKVRVTVLDGAVQLDGCS
jgi:rare lipoprotein A